MNLKYWIDCDEKRKNLPSPFVYALSFSRLDVPFEYVLAYPRRVE